MKLKWLIDNVEAVKKAVEEDRCLFGTVDSWLIWVILGFHYLGVLHSVDVLKQGYCSQIIIVDYFFSSEHDWW